MASVFTENLVGRVLDGRYALLSLVGVGASARVYRAEDRRLRRFVAVKVLHGSFADDEGFVRRFRREAESLAPLSHPNIVTVFDVNDGANASGEPPFLVTEYLSGGTLWDLLESGYRLTPSQAGRVALGAARGLEFAHSRGLVHRDVKPANLLFGEDQHVRIGDFGLATVLADFGRTQQGNAPVGSPRYQSPEQARGAKIDGRSDVYSLALVLVEAVTGSVPFTADTWTGHALARLEGSLKAPPELEALGPVVEAAGMIDPEDRVDAAGLVRLLESIARTMPRPESLPLDGSRLAARRPMLDRDPTRHVGLDESEPTVDTTTAVETPAVTDAASVLPTESIANERARRGGVFDITLDDRVAESGDAVPVVLPIVPDKKPDRASRKAAKGEAKPVSDQGETGALDKPGKRGIFKRLAALVVLVAVAAGVVGMAVARRTPTHLVPTLTGKSIADAQKLAATLKFNVHEGERVFDANTKNGSVISQTPAIGVRLKEKRIIEVVVSKGIQPVPIPDLSGLSYDAASGALRALNLRILTPPITEDSTTIPQGGVIRWSPTAAVAPGSVVSVVVSSGPPTVAVPKLVGLGEEAVTTAISAGIVPTIVRQASDSPKGLVFATKPAAGEIVAKGTEVKIFVSTGPAFADVPNVIGLLPADASAALRKAGFKVGNTIGPADQPVLHTRPLRNTKAKRGSVVTLYTTEDNVPTVPGVATTETTRPGVTVSTLLPPPDAGAASTTTAKP